MIPVGWLFALERIAPGALLLLCIAWLAAMYGARRLAVRAAQRLADQNLLTGEDRENFLEWNQAQQKLRATAMVFPVAAVTWVGPYGVACPGQLDDDGQGGAGYAPRPGNVGRPCGLLLPSCSV